MLSRSTCQVVGFTCTNSYLMFFLLLGNCEIGWAFVLTMSGGVISIVLSAMPHLIAITSTSSAHSVRPISVNGFSGLKLRHGPSRDRWSMGQYPLLSVPMDTSDYHFSYNLQPSPPDPADDGDGMRRSLRTRSLVLQPQSCDTIGGGSVYRMDLGHQNHRRLSMTSSCMFSCIPEQSPLDSASAWEQIPVSSKFCKHNYPFPLNFDYYFK